MLLGNGQVPRRVDMGLGLICESQMTKACVRACVRTRNAMDDGKKNRSELVLNASCRIKLFRSVCVARFEARGMTKT